MAAPVSLIVPAGLSPISGCLVQSASTSAWDKYFLIGLRLLGLARLFLSGFAAAFASARRTNP
jgi:hypothetical protein